jgi:hypothetical protein
MSARENIDDEAEKDGVKRALSRSGSTSSFLDSLHNVSDSSDDDLCKRTTASELDRYFTLYEGAECGKEPDDILKWWKVSPDLAFGSCVI